MCPSFVIPFVVAKGGKKDARGIKGDTSSLLCSQAQMVPLSKAPKAQKLTQPLNHFTHPNAPAR
jgi:hypothetical protein